MAQLQFTDLLLASRDTLTYKFTYNELIESLNSDLDIEGGEYELKSRISFGGVGSLVQTKLEYENDQNTDVAKYRSSSNVDLVSLSGSGSGAKISYSTYQENDGISVSEIFDYEITSSGLNYNVDDRLSVPNGCILTGTPTYGDSVYEDFAGNPLGVGAVVGVTTTGSGYGALFTVTAATAGVLSGLEVKSAGNGYAAGDVLQVEGFAVDADGDPIGTPTTYTVDTVGDDGVILVVQRVNEDVDSGVAYIELQKTEADGTESIVNNIKLVPDGSIEFSEYFEGGSLVPNAIKVKADEGGIDELPTADTIIIIDAAAPVPSDPSDDYNIGTLWYNTTTGRLFVYLEDKNITTSSVRYWVDASPSHINEEKFVKTVGDENINGSLTIANDTDNGTISAQHFNIAALSPLP